MILEVGARVLVAVGWWAGQEGVVTEIIETDHTDRRYDVSCSPGRWYYPDELQVVVEAL